jgi:hypothetical protein
MKTQRLWNFLRATAGREYVDRLDGRRFGHPGSLLYQRR